MPQSLIKVIKNSNGRGSSHLRVVLEIEGIFKGVMTRPINSDIPINFFKSTYTHYLIFIFFLPISGICQTYYSFHTSGNWTDAANWSPSYPGTNPNDNSIFQIYANCTVDLQTTITIGNNTGFDVFGGGVLNFNGTLNVLGGSFSGISVTSWDIVNFDGTLVVGESAELYMESYGGTGWWGVFNFGPNANFSTNGGTIYLSRTNTLELNEINITCNPAPIGFYISGWDSNINLTNTTINVDWVSTNLPVIGQNVQLIQLNNNCIISGFNASNFNIEPISGLTFTPFISSDNKSITIQVTSPLPIIYQNKPTAKIHNNQSHIAWSVSSQINNEKYIIEHSKNGKTFSSIGEIAGDGTINETKHYEYIHLSPSIGINYYRIKQVDYNGQYSYSDIVSVFVKGEGNDVSIYPNPSTNIINVNGANGLYYTIYDLVGRQVIDGQISDDAISIDHFSTGMYYLHLDSDAGQSVYKIWKE